MKKIKFMAATFVVIVATACNDKADEPTYSPSNQDAAKIMGESWANSTGGMAHEIATQGIAFEAKSGEIELECGVPFDTTFSTSISGSLNGAFTRSWNILLNCPEGDTPFIDINTSYIGTLDGPYKNRERNGSRNWIWTEIGSVGDLRIMNGSGDHNGSRTFNATEAIFAWDYDAEWTNVTVSKETNQISSGSGVFTMVMTGPEGNIFNFDGTVIFNGDQTATLSINGEAYEIELG